MSIKLSICIPTYNRASFIGEALDSVIEQANEDVEIVIVDGASTDNTTEIIRKYQQKFRNLVYCRGDKKLGVDRDMAKTIELARGQYCWMLSDDDIIEPGAISRILNEIESECEIYLCNVTTCDLQMKPFQKRFWLSSNEKDRVFNLHKSNEFIEYCNKAISLGAFFSYMSSIILRRESWNIVGFDLEFNGTAYALASSLLALIKTNCRLKYIQAPLVLCRYDNPTFSFAGGLVKRFLLDFDGYLKLSDKYLAENFKARKAFLGVMQREHPWYTIINVTSFIDNKEQWHQFRCKLLKFGYNAKLINFLFLLGRNRKLVSFAVTVKRWLIRNGVTFPSH